MTKQMLKSSRIYRSIGMLAVIAILGATASQSQKAPAPPQAPPPNAANAEVHILKVRDNIYMLVGAGGNITVDVGDDGVLMVDDGLANMSDKVIAALRSITDKPLRTIVNTHIHADHTGGNLAIGKIGVTVTGGNVAAAGGVAGTGNGATIVAYQTVADRMADSKGKDAAPDGAWPTDAFATPRKDIFFNNESIVLYHVPAAHTDGDTIVYFRSKDVVATGDVFTTTNYPFIDIDRGGSIQGEIDALNLLLYNITVPGPEEEGGTLVIPGHGRLCNQADITAYQEMVIIIRDRIQAMVKKGMTSEQVVAAKPTRDYDPRYANTAGMWTPDKFVAAVYKNLKEAK
jgi:cyclase